MLLTLDLGTTYLKTALFDRCGKVCALHRMPTPITHPERGHWEIAPEQFREGIAQAIAALAGSTSRGLAEIAAVTFSTQSNSFLLLDAEDRPLTPLIIWADERAASFEDQVRHLSQTPGFQRTTGVPELNRQYALAKLLWLRGHRPDIWQCAKRLCLISDYLTLWLTGKHVTEAGASGLLGMVDIHQLGWWPKVCEQVEVPGSWLPTVVRAGTDTGLIRPQAADALGLPRTCRFVVGCLDQYAGAMGVGNTVPGAVSETTGTVLATVRCASDFDPSVESTIFQGPGFDTKCSLARGQPTCWNGIGTAYPTGRISRRSAAQQPMSHREPKD
jgi:sugar (pentulose or hexulose) kinase